MILFQFQSAPKPPSGLPTYSQEDYSLIVAPGGTIPNGLTRVSAGDLTFFFDKDAVLVALDAYLNLGTTDRRDCSVAPECSKVGAIRYMGPFDINGIAAQIEQTPKFSYDVLSNVLRIEIDPPSGTDFCLRTMGCLTIRITAQGTLSEIWVSGLTLIG